MIDPPLCGHGVRVGEYVALIMRENDAPEMVARIFELAHEMPVEEAEAIVRAEAR